MKLYLKIAGFIVLMVVSFGGVLPFLISAKSTEAVVGGVVYILLLIPFTTKWAISIFKNIMEKTKCVKEQL